MNVLSLGQRNALRAILSKAQWEAVYAALGQYVDNNDPEELAVCANEVVPADTVEKHLAAQEVLGGMDADLAALAGPLTEEEEAVLAKGWVQPPTPPAPPPAPKRQRARRV